MKHSAEGKVNRIAHTSTWLSLANITPKDEKQVVQACIVHDSICIA